MGGLERAGNGGTVGARGWGLAWLGTVVALALHMIDEATHDFLSFYNPAALSVRERFPWFPLPTFELAGWLGTLALVLVALLLLAPWAFRGARWMRPLSWALAILIGANGLLHFAAALTLRAMIPGVLTAPLLLLAAFCLAGCIPKRRGATQAV